MAMTLRLTPEQDRALALLAQAQGSSKHEAAVRAIASAAARLLNDEVVAQLARDLIPGRTNLEATIRQARP
ncbi:CopG family transcriptional regulator [Corynebacterium alimapuense]|uniref:CopG family transcriptional regulator n=1 Tax=Corynebacterium alimapuense TaxID=1576874 RepID=A0A3M8K6J5_9CORY|nr:CopG family transcriptional regulator [Corynebacterium alimapuense]RNE48138.1 CopG family transcriptional regulator [Corynebacterium alimapuense]